MSWSWKRFPLRYNAVAGVKVHGSNQHGGKIYAARAFPGKLRPAFSWNIISKRNPFLFIAHFRQTFWRPHGEPREDIWSTLRDPTWNLSTCAKSPSPENEASDRVSWLGFLWLQSDPPNKHHDRGPTSHPTNETSHVLPKSLDPNLTIRSQTPAVRVNDNVSKHKHHPKRVQ